MRGMGRGGPSPWPGRGGGYGHRYGARDDVSTYKSEDLNPLPKPADNVTRVIATALDDKGVESHISPRFARAPYIVVVDIVDKAIVSVKAIPNMFANIPSGAGASFSQWIIESGAKIVITPNVGPHASMILQQAGVRIYRVLPNTRVIDALRSLGLVRS